MDPPPQRLQSRRRPHSASSVVPMETLRATSWPVSMETGSTRLPSGTDLIMHEQTSSDLDFTDKLKALRELITSSKMHKERRRSGADRSGSRIIAKRTDVPNFCDAKQVDKKLQFSASSFERRELASRAHDMQLRGENLAKSTTIQGKMGDDFDEELSVDSDDQKYLPLRLRSAFGNYDHLFSKDLDTFGYPAHRRAFITEADVTDKRDFMKTNLEGRERVHSSLGLSGPGFGVLDVPERDWNVPRQSSLSSPFPNCNSGDMNRDVIESKLNPHKKYGESILVNGESHHREKDELIKVSTKDQYVLKDRSKKHSPPEHDRSFTTEDGKSIQTNVKVFLKKSSVHARPHSAEPSRNMMPTDKDNGGADSPFGGQSAKEVNHWTHLLSQKRAKSDHVSRSVHSSPVQSNVSVEFPSRASPYAYLLQEAAKQQNPDSLHPKSSKESQSLRSQTKLMESVGENKVRRKTRDMKVVSEDLLADLEVMGDEKLQDDEVASIMEHPRPKKRIIVKRSAGKATGDMRTDRRQLEDQIKTMDKKHATGQQSRMNSEHKTNVTYLGDSEHFLSQERSLTAPPTTKDDHIMTLDKLRAALRGMRSDSRTTSQASSLSMASPSPMKAVHMSEHLSREESRSQSVGPHVKETHADSKHRRVSESNQELELVPGKQRSDIAGDATGKAPHRRIFRRPPGLPAALSKSAASPSKAHGVFKQSSSHQKGVDREVPISAVSSEPERDLQMKRQDEFETRAERPSSAAPHLALMSSTEGRQSPNKSSAGRSALGSEFLKRSMPSVLTTKQSSSRSAGRISQLEASRRRSRSSTDFSEQERARKERAALRNNVQRLHQEVSMRVAQDAYLMQNLMNRVNDLDPNARDPGDIDPDGKIANVSHSKTENIRRRLSFDEDGTAAEKINRPVSRGQRYSPFDVEGLETKHEVGPSGAAGVMDIVLNSKGSSHDAAAIGASQHEDKGDCGELVTSTPLKMLHASDSDLSGAAQDGTIKQGPNILKKTDSSQLSPRPQNGLGNSVSGNLRQNGVLHLKDLASIKSERHLISGLMLAGSTFSGKNAADTILSHLGNASMVHLLQKLYTADDQTRQAIMTKAQVFKHWQSTAHVLKQQRQVYTESLHRAQVYLNNKLRHRFFHFWHNSAEENRKNRAADAIYRHHMLRKGLQAFSWAITRSKHQCNTLRHRVNTMNLRAAFTKWHSLAAALREQRMRAAFTRWQEFTWEEKSIRAMQKSQSEKLVCQTMEIWQQALDRHVKENLADCYLRLTLLRHFWQTWCEFTQASREKALRQQTADNFCKRNLQRRTLQRMKTALHQSRLAHQHFRLRRLKRMLQRWRQGAQISRVERQRDMATSLEHWRHTTTCHTFIRWCQQLQHHRATTMANNNLSRKTFEHWRQVWRVNTERRQEIEVTITRSRLHNCLLMWRRNVVDRRRRQKQAVALLEMCLMRGTLLAWRNYTAYKTGFRASLQLHVRVIEHMKISQCFAVWKESLEKRLDEHRRHELWSLSCVRKATTHWRHICHLHHLEDILCATQPHRELGLIRWMFGRWLAAKVKAEEENAEVVTSCHILERCSLQRQFQAWRLATHRTLTIKPLIQRRQRMLVTWCFDAWHEYMEGRVQRKHNVQLFQRNQLAKSFTRWRRQYHCQQIARSAQQNSHQRLTFCLLLEWRNILHRKHLATDYNHCNLLRRTFFWWSTRAMQQLEDRRERHAQQELSQRLKQQYFKAWWSGVQQQIAANEEAVSHLQQYQAHNYIRSAFTSWRRSLHTHLIMRAYQRSASMRLQRTVLLEWHAAASHSLSSAVQRFVQQLGLDDNFEAGSTANSFGELLALEDMDHCDSPRSSSTTSLSTSVRRLFSSESERVVDGDLDRMSLLSFGLSETLDSRQLKNQRMQEIALTFVTRLLHWPISLAFSEWCEYTLRQRELRQLSQQVKDMHHMVTMAMTFCWWHLHYINSQKAAAFRNKKLLSNSLMVLYEYSQQQKAKAVLAAKARSHLVKHVLSKVFPMWLEKAQEQRHERSILRLWTTATPEEMELLPLEMSLGRQMRQRSLRECFSVWHLRFQFLLKLKTTYHKQLLSRVMLTWQEWASIRQEQCRKGNNFLQARRKSLVFKTWCERLHQKRETEVRYHAAWQGYVCLIFRCWHDWASASKQRELATALLKGRCNRNCLAASFATWRRLTEIARAIHAAQQARLTSRVFAGWRRVVQEKKELRQVTLTFQAACLARQVGRLFQEWRQRYQDRLRAQKKRQQLAEQSALHCGRVWRKKAQITRGRKLIVVFKYSRLSQIFAHWRSALKRIRALKLHQEAYLVEKNKALMHRLLVEWHQKLQSAVITRNFTQRLLASVLEAWRSQAHASRERRIRGLALQKAIHEQNLRFYFKYWCDLAIRVRSLQNNVEVKLQLRVLQAWRYTVRRRCSQRRMGEKFFTLRQHRQMAAAFMTLRCRFDYCQGLKETADKMCTVRERALARVVLMHWKDRYDRRLAARFYTHLLAVRTANRWHQYVACMKAEREYEALQYERAVTHHNKHICFLVLEALRKEVTVSRQLRQRQLRLAFKFAVSWKHITDMAVTAGSIEQGKLYAKYWRVWRLAWVRHQVCRREEAMERRQLLSLVFTAWCSICPSHVQLQQRLSGNRRPRSLASETRSDSPSTPRSFLPVPVSGSRKASSDHPPQS